MNNFNDVDMISFAKFINSEDRKVLNSNREPDVEKLNNILDNVTKKDLHDWYNYFNKKLMIVQIINESNNDLPFYAKEGDSGMDLRADLTNVKEEFLFSAEYDEVGKTLTILPGGRALVPINIKTSIPPYQEFQIRSRSGLAIKHGIFVLNSPGTIDAKLKF